MLYQFYVAVAVSDLLNKTLMKILHGTWILEAENGFIQKGTFYLWVETTEASKKRQTASNIHPCQLFKSDLEAFLSQELGIKPEQRAHLVAEQISPQYFLLPSSDIRPLPSLELARYLEQDIPETFELQYWQGEIAVGDYRHVTRR